MASAIRSGRFLACHPDCLRERKPGVKVDRIVLHVADGTYTGTASWFGMGRAARARALGIADLDDVVPTCAHYLISRMGDVTQFADDRAKLLHANAYNSRSVGIEHEGWTDGLWRYGLKPWKQVDTPFPDAMLAASAEVVRILCGKFAIPLDREHVIGHNEVPGASHTDPGALWPWERYVALLEA